MKERGSSIGGEGGIKYSRVQSRIAVNMRAEIVCDIAKTSRIMLQMVRGIVIVLLIMISLPVIA